MDWMTDAESGARCAQAMVPMRDGVRLNTFVFLPREGARFPVILHRTPYGIAASDARESVSFSARPRLLPHRSSQREAT